MMKKKIILLSIVSLFLFYNLHKKDSFELTFLYKSLINDDESSE